MDIQYFINKFEAIPEEKWGTGAYQLEDGRRCALGHCLPILDSCPTTYVRALDDFPVVDWRSEEFNALLLLQNYGRFSVAQINDEECIDYDQETPKQRVLAFLRYLKEVEEQDKAVEQTNKILSEEVVPAE